MARGMALIKSLRNWNQQLQLYINTSYKTDSCFVSLKNSSHLSEFLQLTVRQILIPNVVSEHPGLDPLDFYGILKQEPKPFVKSKT